MAFFPSGLARSKSGSFHRCFSAEVECCANAVQVVFTLEYSCQARALENQLGGSVKIKGFQQIGERTLFENLNPGIVRDESHPMISWSGDIANRIMLGVIGEDEEVVRVTGFTPGRLFQMATKRSADQPAASSARSFWLAKDTREDPGERYRPVIGELLPGAWRARSEGFGRGHPASGTYSGLWLLRRITIAMVNRIATPAQTRRTMVESISKSSFLKPYRLSYMFSIIGIRSRTSRVITGPIVTTNSDGSTQKKIGNTSFTASFPASSSALCRAMVRR